MDTDIVHIRRWFWAWQDEAEERWLEDMARKGLYFENVTKFGLYTFKKGQPGDFVYRLDYQGKEKKDLGDYLQLFHDAGWEYVGDINGWQYFRKPRVTGGTNEIFTDNRSKIEKYQRYMLMLLVVLAITTAVIVNSAVTLQFSRVATMTVFYYVRAVLWIFFSIADGIIIYTVLRLNARIRQLREAAQ